MDKLTPQNVQLYPARKVIVPNDRDTKTLFNYSAETYRRRLNNPDGFIIVEVKNHKRFGKIKTPVKLTIDPTVAAADPTLTEPLSQFDFDVATVCISSWHADKRRLSPAIIYRCLTGKIGQHDFTPSKDQLAAIMHSLKKLMNVHLDIYLHDACIKLGYNKGKPITISNYIIPAQIGEGFINGQRTTVIDLTAESPLLTVATVKNNQLIAYDARILNIPRQNNTPLHIELKHYIMRRVMEIIAHPKEMTPSITFADVFEKCGLENASPSKKWRIRKFIESFIAHLLKCGVLTSYQVNKKDNNLYSISFTFPQKASKAERMKTSEQIETRAVSGAVGTSQIRSCYAENWQWTILKSSQLPKNQFYIVLTPLLPTLQPSPNSL